MWKLHVREATDAARSLVFIFDDQGELRWSGKTLLGAYRFLAEWGQPEVVTDVDSLLWKLGTDEPA